MMIVFALCAALGYGLSDFAGGVAARRVRPRVALCGGELAGAALVMALLPVWPGGFDPAALLCAAGAGAAGLTGLGLMYRLMAIQPLSLVSPITAVLAAATPLGYGVAVGERPSPLAWVGVSAALVAVVLIGGPETSNRSRLGVGVVVVALGAGLGFGGYFVLVAQAAHVGGVSSLLVARLTSVAILAPLTLRGRRTRSSARQTTPLGHAAVPVSGGVPASRATRVAVIAVGAAGLADAAADACFLFATRSGYLSFAGVVTSLYPAVTVLLAFTLLRERVGWRPCAGISLSVVSLALIAS